MNYKFKYAAGLPGYGINGMDGSIGLAGFSVYLTDWDGNVDVPSLETRIQNNHNLISGTDVSILGWPTRKYQNNDIFIDKNGKIFTLTNIGQSLPQYVDSGLSFGTSNFLDRVIETSDNNYTRYANTKETAPDRKLIDTVFGDNTGYFNFPSDTIYGIYPIDYGQIFHSSVISAGTNYNPYFLFNNNETDAKCALALVRDTSDPLNLGQFRLGNTDGGGKIRDTNLHLDIHTLTQTRGWQEVHSPILTEWDIDASILFNNRNFDSISTALNFSQDGSTVTAVWNSLQILCTSTYSNTINANLVIYPVTINDASTLIYDKETGALEDTITKSKYKTNVLERIAPIDSVGITGLDENVQYAAYIEYEQNGWLRRTNKRTSANAYPIFKYIKFDQNPIEVDGASHIINVIVLSSVVWSIQSFPTWMVVTLVAGGISVNITGQDNLAIARSGEIVLSGDGITSVLKVYQAASSVQINPDYDSGWKSLTRGSAAHPTDPYSISIRRIGKLCIVQGYYWNGDISGQNIIGHIPYSDLAQPGEVVTPISTSIYFQCGSQMDPAQVKTTNVGVVGKIGTIQRTVGNLELTVMNPTTTHFDAEFNINFSFFLG